MMNFFVLKSYDGGRTWEQARRCDDFTSAAQAAAGMRSQHPMIRFRIDVETPRRAPRHAGHPARSRPANAAQRKRSSSARK
ncbi:MAG: hypothetical protein ACE5H2_06615 [Terriglobia bacterium]